MNTNPWLVDSIKAFSFLNCPECAFRSKEENLFSYHAARNHPLSTAFFDKQIELEQSTIGLKPVEYRPDLDFKVEALPSKVTNESNDPLECIATNINGILAYKEGLKIQHSLDEPTTFQQCEKESISISKLQTHYEECPNNESLEDFDESFENDYENINSGTDEAHEDFDESITDKIFTTRILADESLTDDGNSGIKDELSESVTQTVILKNPVYVKKLQKRRKLETKRGPCTICGKLYDTNRMKRHIDSAHTPNPMPDPNSNYEVVVGERENSKLYAKDGFLYTINSVRVKQAFLK